MTMREQKKPARSPVVISIDVNDKFYKAFQKQLEEGLSSMTPEQIIALLLLLGAASLISNLIEPEAEAEKFFSKSEFAWNYLSQLQKLEPDSEALGNLLHQLNYQVVINDSPVELLEASDTEGDELGDPFENFKQGWDDAMSGRTMSYEEFERRMLEDAD